MLRFEDVFRGKQDGRIGMNMKPINIITPHLAVSLATGAINCGKHAVQIGNPVVYSPVNAFAIKPMVVSSANPMNAMWRPGVGLQKTGGLQKIGNGIRAAAGAVASGARYVAEGIASSYIQMAFGVNFFGSSNAGDDEKMIYTLPNSQVALEAINLLATGKSEFPAEGAEDVPYLDLALSGAERENMTDEDDHIFLFDEKHGEHIANCNRLTRMISAADASSEAGDKDDARKTFAAAASLADTIAQHHLDMMIGFPTDAAQYDLIEGMLHERAEDFSAANIAYSVALENFEVEATYDGSPYMDDIIRAWEGHVRMSMKGDGFGSVSDVLYRFKVWLSGNGYRERSFEAHAAAIASGIKADVEWWLSENIDDWKGLESEDRTRHFEDKLKIVLLALSDPNFAATYLYEDPDKGEAYVGILLEGIAEAIKKPLSNRTSEE